MCIYTAPTHLTRSGIVADPDPDPDLLVQELGVQLPEGGYEGSCYTIVQPCLPPLQLVLDDLPVHTHIYSYIHTSLQADIHAHNISMHIHPHTLH